MRDLSASVFATTAVQDSLAVPNQNRFDFVIGYNVLSALQGAGVLR